MKNFNLRPASKAPAVFITGIRKKLKNCKGMSLGEVLAAILIMLMATSLLASAVSIGIKQYTASLSHSEANLLSSTLQSIISNELAYTTEVRQETDAEGGNIIVFQSQNYAVSNNLSHFYVEDGKVMIGGEDESETSVSILADGSYPNGLAVENLLVTYDDTAEEHVFQVSMDITRKGTKIQTQTFQVINVNQVDLE